MKKQIKFIIILFVAVAVVSGCSFKKQNEKKPETLNNQVPNQATSAITVDEWKDAETIYSPEDYDYTGWKTYTNKDLGYEVKYPADWIINSCDEGCFSKEVTFNPPNAEDFVSYVSISFSGMSLTDTRNGFLDPTNWEGRVYTEKKVLFNSNKSFFYFNGPLEDRISIVFTYNDKVFVLQSSRIKNDSVGGVLASFKFIK